MVELLLRRRAEIKKQESKGRTALMAAASHGHERVIELLLRHGAEIDMQKTLLAAPR